MRRFLSALLALCLLIGPVLGQVPIPANQLQQTSSAPATDPFFANVTLLAFNENASNGTTTFTDQSSSPRTLTRIGNTVWSSSVQFSGVNTVLFDGTGDGVSSVANAAFAMGTGDYTVEAYVRVTSLASNRAIYELKQTGPDDDTDLVMTTTGVLDLWVLDTDYNSSAGAVTTNTIYHIAVSRTSSVTKVFVNGTQVSSNSDSHNHGTSRSLFVGILDDSVSGPFVGNMAGLRITKGVGRYTGSFTPPALPLPTS